VIKKFLQNIFRKISYYLFLKIYGKIEKSISSDSDKRIFVLDSDFGNKLKYKVYKIEQGRLYTDRIHDTAAILDNKIIEGPSFQLRRNNNSIIRENIVFKKGTPRILSKLNGAVLSLLTGGGGNENYWHWLYDVLPRLEICQKVIKLEEIDYFLLPNLKKNFQQETLTELNFSNKKLLSSEKFRHIKAKELIVTDHPYILSNNAHKDSQKIPKWIINWLREKFLTSSKKTKREYPKNIYIDRDELNLQDKSFRRIINEVEIKNYLIKRNFKLLKLHEMDFLNQVHIFNNADCIVGLHGAGFANLAFCKNDTKIIEFRTEKTGTVIENIAKLNNLKFRSIICKPVSHDYSKQSGHIKISLDILEQKLQDV
jgi:capsular polysaccharide biosynthesis protein